LGALRRCLECVADVASGYLKTRRSKVNPMLFDPDRFTADKVKERSRYAFLPFGGGPRVCIGASFATIEAAAILAVLVRAFRFLPVAGHKPKPVARVTLRPAGGLPILVAARAREPLASRTFSEARKAFC
jgi:cytochrome P450